MGIFLKQKKGTFRRSATNNAYHSVQNHTCPERAKPTNLTVLMKSDFANYRFEVVVQLVTITITVFFL